VEVVEGLVGVREDDDDEEVLLFFADVCNVRASSIALSAAADDECSDREAPKETTNAVSVVTMGVDLLIDDVYSADAVFGDAICLLRGLVRALEVELDCDDDDPTVPVNSLTLRSTIDTHVTID
jgi:hypothetical protein